MTAAVRDLGEGIEEDPARLDALRARRQLLVDLRRKYGDTLEAVLAFHAEAAERLQQLEGHDRRAAELDAARSAARSRGGGGGRRGGQGPSGRGTGPGRGRAGQPHRARDGPGPRGGRGRRRDPADEVAVLLAANPGAPPLPLAKVASGGELARTMLALRLVLTAGPPSLVFDEVDAGIGGAAALAVGRSLAALADDQQVFVVTHLPQVAAFADAHVQVTKESGDDRRWPTSIQLDGADRVVELSRMLSGPAREHLGPRPRRRAPGTGGRTPEQRVVRWRAKERRGNGGHRLRPGRHAHQASGEARAARRRDGDRPPGPRPRGGRDDRGGAGRGGDQRVASITGRYPNVGPLLVCAGGDPAPRRGGPEVLAAHQRGPAGHGRRRRGARRRGGRGVRNPPEHAAHRGAGGDRPPVDGRGARAVRREHALVPQPGGPPPDRRSRHPRHRGRVPGPPRPDRGAGHRLQGRPRRPPPQRATWARCPRC